jgi:hypothetical protein
MSRVQRLLMLAGLAMGSLVWLAMVVYQMAIPPEGMGAVGEPVTAWGIVQLVLSALGAAGFTGAGVREWIIGLIQRVSPGVKAGVANDLIDVGKIATMYALVQGATDPAIKAKWTEAARTEMDGFRDSIFPAT